MSGLLRTGLGKVALGVVTVGLAAGGVVAATALSASGSSAAAPVVDHFLCYGAHTSVPVGFTPPAAVQLINQFSPNGFTAKIGSAIDAHCNPVQKTVYKTLTGPPVVTQIKNPNAHLLCWSFKAPPQLPHVVKVTNQFGTADLKTGQPGALCLPSWKSLTGPPKQPAAEPPGLSHFTCYPVSYDGTARFQIPAKVLVKDQFNPGAPVLVTVSTLVDLCLPTTKIANGVTYPMVNSVTHLLCFNITKTPIKNPVWDKNQFGTGKVNLATPPETLCLPSTKTILH